jgi:hypothetical protein
MDAISFLLGLRCIRSLLLAAACGLSMVERLKLLPGIVGRTVMVRGGGGRW